MKEKVQRLIEEVRFDVKVVVSEANSNEFLIGIGIDDVFQSASLIKVPIMLAVLDYVEDNNVSLNQVIAIKEENVVDFSMITEQGLKNSTIYDLLVGMIITSDNAATNVLIDFIGMDNLNQYFKKIGLTQTILNRKMMDFEQVKKGLDNVTTARDMSVLFRHIYRQDLLTPKNCELALNILKRQRIYESLKRYLVDDVTIAHKTGSLDTVEHDVGIVFSPLKDYMIGIFVTNHCDNEEAKRLIGRISKVVYQHFVKKDEDSR